MPRLLIVLGVLFVAAGVAWWLAESLGLGRLPGDIVIERPGFKLYFPLMTSLIVSIVLSLIFWLLAR